MHNEVDSEEGENFTAHSKKRKIDLTNFDNTENRSVKRKQRSPRLKQDIIDAGWKVYNEPK